VVWSKIAERCAQYLHKGSAVLIEGYLQTRTFVDRDNQNRKVVEVVASRVNFLEKEYNDSSNQNYSSSQDSNQMEATTTDDDVPF
jgi:single-strand DNA-binding protein